MLSLILCVGVRRLSPLHYAVQAGDVDIVRHFCQLTSLADLPDSDGRRPLHWAVVENNPQILAVSDFQQRNLSFRGLKERFDLPNLDKLVADWGS